MKAATSRRGLVTSPHTLATEAGVAVLAQGGNAIEAALASAAVLAVVMPHFTGLGGDAFWLVADAKGAARALSGIGQASRRRPLQVQGAHPVRGAASATTTAAAVDTWDRAFALSRDHWAGRCTWGDLLQPAIDHARRGVPVAPSQAFWHDFRRSEQAAWPGFAATFHPEGRAPAAGEVLRLPALAATLEQLARHGARDFYDGELAARIAAGLQAAGSPLDAADLAHAAA